MASPVPPATDRWRTRANALTALRLVAAPLLAMAIWEGHAGPAHALFWLAVGTDLLDGRVARRYDEATPIGGLFDHATDATFVSAGLLAVAWRGEIPIWLPVLIVSAFVQYTFDSRALAGRPLRASSLGRWNGIAYFVLLGIPVVRDGLGLGWPPASWVAAIGWALVVTTLVSMGDRVLALRSTPLSS